MSFWSKQSISEFENVEAEKFRIEDEIQGMGILIWWWKR